MVAFHPLVVDRRHPDCCKGVVVLLSLVGIDASTVTVHRDIHVVAVACSRRTVAERLPLREMCWRFPLLEMRLRLKHRLVLAVVDAAVHPNDETLVVSGVVQVVVAADAGRIQDGDNDAVVACERRLEDTCNGHVLEDDPRQIHPEEVVEGDDGLLAVDNTAGLLVLDNGDAGHAFGERRVVGDPMSPDDMDHHPMLEVVAERETVLPLSASFEPAEERQRSISILQL